MKKNCWEVKNCGRQPGGPKADELGICPSAVAENFHGAHGGKNAGRACWAVAGSLCGGKRQGTFAKKLRNCWECEFLRQVEKEEGLIGFSLTELGMKAIMKKKLQPVSVSASPALTEQQ